MDSNQILLIIGKFFVNLVERNLQRFRVLRGFKLLIPIKMWVGLTKKKFSMIEYASISRKGQSEALLRLGGHEE